MKVAIVSESPADEAAIRVLVDGILEEPTEPASPVRTRPQGWTDVLRVLPAVMREMHYHADTDGLVVVVDSDRSTPHEAEHEKPGGEQKACRLCSLHGLVRRVLEDLTPIPGRPRLRVAAGLAVPSVEAWYLCGVDPAVSEATWINARKRRELPYDVSALKRQVYGTDRPSVAEETAKAVGQAQRIVSEERLPQLERDFPMGFGSLARDLRSW